VVSKKGIADAIAFVIAVFIGGLLWILAVVISDVIDIFKRKD
jgi:hypothetical protein